MDTRRAACAALLALAVLTAGCSGDSSSRKPAATPAVEPAAARQACVDAWADLIDTAGDVDMDDEPTECAGLPEDDSIDRFMDGLLLRNPAARDAFDQYGNEGATQP